MTQGDVLGFCLAYTVLLLPSRSKESVWPPVWKLPLPQWRLWQRILISVRRLHGVHLQGMVVLRGCRSSSLGFSVNIVAKHDVPFIRGSHSWCHVRVNSHFRSQGLKLPFTVIPENSKLVFGGENWTEGLSAALAKLRQMHMASFSGADDPQWNLWHSWQ